MLLIMIGILLSRADHEHPPSPSYGEASEQEHDYET